MIIRESLRFERSGDPKTSMDIGRYRSSEMFKKIKEFIETNQKRIIGLKIPDFNPNNINQYALDHLLVECARLGNMEYVKYLLSKGANLYCFDHYILIRTADENQYEMAKFLIEMGLNPKKHDSYALYVAKENGNLEMVKLLLQNGARATSKNSSNLYRLHLTNDHKEKDQKAVIDYIKKYMKEVYNKEY